MSETEHYKGKLKPTGKTVDQYMEGVVVPEYYSNKEDYFRDEMYETTIEISGEVYEITREYVPEYEDIFTATLCEDYTIDFEVKYYNGGCGFGEALEEAVKGIV